MLFTVSNPAQQPKLLSKVHIKKKIIYGRIRAVEKKKVLFLVRLLLYDNKFANWNDQSFGDTCLVPGCLARKISQIRIKKR